MALLQSSPMEYNNLFTKHHQWHGFWIQVSRGIDLDRRDFSGGKLHGLIHKI